ncbi:MAG: heavy metal-associated domain-containing protein [Candidatus Micrarchaeota archaeon]
MIEKTLNVKGMHCKSCEMILNDSISEIKGVTKVNSDFSKGQVRVSYENELVLNEIKNIIKKEGYQVE